MKIEEAIEIIDSSNFYNCFDNDKQDEAFYTAYKALGEWLRIKEEAIDLGKTKGDHAAIVLSNYVLSQVEKIENTCKNCILYHTDACSCYAVKYDEICEDFIKKGGGEDGEQ